MEKKEAPEGARDGTPLKPNFSEDKPEEKQPEGELNKTQQEENQPEPSKEEEGDQSLDFGKKEENKEVDSNEENKVKTGYHTI